MNFISSQAPRFGTCANEVQMPFTYICCYFFDRTMRTRLSHVEHKQSLLSLATKTAAFLRHRINSQYDLE